MGNRLLISVLRPLLSSHLLLSLGLIAALGGCLGDGGGADDGEGALSGGEPSGDGDGDGDVKVTASSGDGDGDGEANALCDGLELGADCQCGLDGNGTIACISGLPVCQCSGVPGDGDGDGDADPCATPAEGCPCVEGTESIWCDPKEVADVQVEQNGVQGVLHCTEAVRFCTQGSWQACQTISSVFVPQ